ncbi:DUF732 domain-containing protein [Candidatus Mycobacterium wuenschmannii]|uniref:DUF732 domain-containing protein n=1 Tax=Candidatus Mycobacterium wuenschmannii TaxID=3027808 RepID=A0ABY8VYB6_9MYCO|nr:DUF732 domain-containing protein [Candidatus Mycobacterium wuenschmannii]WIM88472.1 DUF732 domain-containing protein [Candidatus Mycobacterium wuenschmannii]
MRSLLAGLGVAVALSLAIPVGADPGVDASFVDALTKAGIGFNDPKNAVEAAKSACALMDEGKSQFDVVQLVMQQNSRVTTVNAAKFTAIASSAYCPQYLQRLKDGGGPSRQPDGGVGASGGAQQ